MQIFLHYLTLFDSIQWSQSATQAACQICKKKRDDMLLCDGCNKGFHLYCLKPKLKVSSFLFCSFINFNFFHLILYRKSPKVIGFVRHANLLKRLQKNVKSSKLMLMKDQMRKEKRMKKKMKRKRKVMMMRMEVKHSLGKFYF